MSDPEPRLHTRADNSQSLRHFFMGRIRLAWRTCGQAGRMAMELGLHSREMSQQCLENDEQRAAVVDLSCSLVVLDRQLSASAGLPNTFQNTDFDLAIGSSVSLTFHWSHRYTDQGLCR